MSSRSRPSRRSRASAARSARAAHEARRRATALPGVDTDLTPERVDTVLALLAGLPPGTLVAIRPDGPDHVAFGLRELAPDPRCGGAGLFGLDAPDGSVVVGLSFEGVSEPSDAPPRAPSDPPLDDVDPTRVDVLVTAQGQVHSRIHDHVQPPPKVRRPARGIVVDALHRTLGLPAPGDPPPLTELVARMWLHEVLRRWDGDAVPTWADAAVAHLDPGGDEPLRGLPPSPEAVVASMQRLADEAAWDDLRRAAAIGRMAAPDLDPDEAAWMDATMFARWMVDSFPSPARALDLLRRAGAHDAADRMEQVLDRLDPPPVPDAA
ncbi:hypothetical protein [Dermatobacter hominis]|uniref:hypothetical protein n=1 Tax=Dermatobacter hominis TaxID=2884263 RepID=UPI001D108265|nr:hypothetical protein [Dermatobacter hominis]UDY37025.1 hypothetical protein LH044_05675 [Dermatobacter hominis]